MIDGVKLLCGLNPADWMENQNLAFRSMVDLGTGEIHRNNRHADTHGLHLSIIEGEKDTFCNLNGSLPKYYTKGETNAIDYSLTDFITTTELLQENLQINPGRAYLRGFEFGLNVGMPIPFTELLECLKTYKMHAYGMFEEKGKVLGAVYTFQQYRVKVYDKGMQKTGKPSRMMRFEIAIRKMERVKHLGIKTLSDLQNPAIWLRLSEILLTVWKEIIYTEKGLKYRLMDGHQQKKYLRFFDIHYWANLNRKQYHTAKGKLSQLRDTYGGGADTKQEIAALLYAKARKLATETAAPDGYDLTGWDSLKNTLGISPDVQPLENLKREQFNHLDKRLEILPILPNSLEQTTTKNIRQDLTTIPQQKKTKKPKCMNCKKTLNKKRPDAKFCGLKCKNHYNGKRRTRERQVKRAGELKYLKQILPKLKTLDLPLLVIYKADGLQYADHLHQSEIKAPPEWLAAIRKVLVLADKTATPVELTTLRAKKLIQAITRLNTKTN